MSLVTEWKSAKEIFKNSTKAKKPSEKFLGLFGSKGTGIEASLKKADTAKTAGELNTALAQFQKDGEAYIKILKGTIADPTSVPPNAKGDYLGAVGKLDAALGRLLTLGQGMANHLDGAGKKDKVDPTVVKKEVVLATHLLLRKKMEPLLSKVRSDFQGQLKEIDECVKQAGIQTANAKREKAQGNRSGAMVAIDVVRRFREKAEGILATVEKEWEKTSKDPNGMMAARTDSSIFPETWPKEKVAKYKDESGQAFRAYDDIQIEIRSLIMGMNAKVKQTETLAEEAETYSGMGVDASVYVKRLTDMNKVLEGLNKWTTDQRNKVAGRHQTQQKVVNEKKSPPEAIKKQFENLLGGEVNLQPEITQRQGAVAELIKRANVIPAEDRKLPSVATLFQTFTVESNKATTALGSYRVEQGNFINFLNQELRKLG